MGWFCRRSFWDWARRSNTTRIIVLSFSKAIHVTVGDWGCGSECYWFVMPLIESLLFCDKWFLFYFSFLSKITVRAFKRTLSEVLSPRESGDRSRQSGSNFRKNASWVGSSESAGIEGHWSAFEKWWLWILLPNPKMTSDDAAPIYFRTFMI